MKFPFVVLSYGPFEQSKKLFSYEYQGQQYFPIFYDPMKIITFRTHIHRILKQASDDRALDGCACSEPAKAKDMFQLLSSLMNITVIIDPVINDSIVSGTVRTVEDIVEELEIQCGGSASPSPADQDNQS